MSSICSAMSEMSVSISGEEIPLEKALDDVFKNLQENLNGTHCSFREYCMLLDRDEEFEYLYEQNYELFNHVDEFNNLMKELKSIIKQIAPKPEDDTEKEWVKQFKARKKQKKQEEKKQEN